MTFELYINKRKVDLASTINLKYVNNMLGDLSKLSNNYSYTINLPKTLNNLSIIEHANRVGTISNFPYIAHDVSLIADGVQIVKRGVCFLLSVSDTIEVSIVWGMISALSDVISSGTMLDEMNIPNEVIFGNGYFTDWTEDNQSGLYSIKYGDKTGRYVDYKYPAVDAVTAFKMIEYASGLSFHWEDMGSEAYNRIRALIVPLKRSVNKYPGITVSSLYLSEISGPGGGKVKTNHLCFSNATSDTEYLKTGGSISVGSGQRWDEPYLSSPYETYRLYLNINIKVRKDKYLDKRDFIITNWVQGSTEYNTKELFRLEPTEDAESYIYQYEGYTDVLHTNSTNYVFYLGTDSTAHSITQPIEGEITVQPCFQTRYKANVPTYFPYVQGLPHIKIVDFIRAICIQAGLYASLKDDRITLKPYDSVMYNINSAIDWSDKLMKLQEDNSPTLIEYAIGDYAQRNVVLYEKEDGIINHYGYLYVDNKMLDKEKTMATLPFIECYESVDGNIVVPWYEFNGDSLVYKEDNSPVIIKRVNGTLRTEYPQEFIDNYYGTLSGMIGTPKVITEKIKLTSVDLKVLDMGVPIYLRQYGAYFAILEIKTNENDVCEVKFIKI